MNSKSLINAIVLQIAMKIRDLSTIQGRIPFLSGDLRKSLTEVDSAVEVTGQGQATVTSNLVYARPVHDGSKAYIIKPKVKKNGKGMTKGGKQPAREGRPFLRWGTDDMQSRGYGFLDELLHDYVSAEIGEQIKDSIELNFTV